MTLLWTMLNKSGVWYKIMNTIQAILTLWEFFVTLIFLLLCLIQYSFFSVAYIILSISYMYAASHIDPAFYNLRMYLGIGFLLTSLITLLLKLIFAGLIISEVYEVSEDISVSFGILVVDKQSINAIEIIKTLVADITILLLSPMFIWNSRQVLERHKKNDESFEKSQVLWMEARVFYQSLLALTIIASIISTLLIPSAIWFVILILNLFLIYQWSFMNFTLKDGWTRFMYSCIYYLIVITFGITYLLQIPMINKQVPEAELTMIGYGYNRSDLEVLFWFRNFIIVCYFYLYHLSQRTRNMKTMYKATFVRERSASKNIAKTK